MAWLGDGGFDWTNVSHRQLSVVERESAASFWRTRWKSGLGTRGNVHRAKVECRMVCRQRALNGVMLKLGAAEPNKLCTAPICSADSLEPFPLCIGMPPSTTGVDPL